MSSRAERFDDVVIDAASRIESRWKGAFPHFELAVEEVPPSDPAPWEVAEVPLGRLFAAQGRTPARIVIYRRPVHTRAMSDADLAALVTEVLTEQIAALLGVEPEDLDPRFGRDHPDAHGREYQRPSTASNADRSMTRESHRDR